MRGRKKEPDGKRVTVCAKVSETKAAAIDAIRGATPRSEWIEDAISAKLTVARSPKSPRQSSPPSPKAPKKLPLTDDDNCPHPKARVLKGFCGACGRMVTA